MPEPTCASDRVPKAAVDAMIRESGAPKHDDGHTDCYYAGLFLAALGALEEQGWTLTPKTVEPERPDFYYEGMDGHGVRLVIDDGSLTAALVCPESGCSPGAQCGSCHRSFDDDETEPCYVCKDCEAPTECWLKGWFDELLPDELLTGRVEFVVPVDVEWDMDHPVVTFASRRGPPAAGESQDPSRDLVNVNEAYRLEQEKNARLRAAHEHGLEMFQAMQSQRDLEYDRAERLRAELRTVTYERDCWKADSGRLRSELQRQAASRDGEQPEPIGDEMTMFRAMGLHSQMGGDPIGLGGLRHTREYAERDARAALADGWSEAWIEGATWRRIDVEGGEHA